MRCPYIYIVLTSKNQNLNWWVLCVCKRALLCLEREVRSLSKYLRFVIRYSIITTCTVNSWNQHRYIWERTLYSSKERYEKYLPHSWDWLKSQTPCSLEQPVLLTPVTSPDHVLGICRIPVPFLLKTVVGLSPQETDSIYQYTYQCDFTTKDSQSWFMDIISLYSSIHKGRDIIVCRCGSETQMWIF